MAIKKWQTGALPGHAGGSAGWATVASRAAAFLFASQSAPGPGPALEAALPGSSQIPPGLRRLAAAWATMMSRWPPLETGGASRDPAHLFRRFPHLACIVPFDADRGQLRVGDPYRRVHDSESWNFASACGAPSR